MHLLHITRRNGPAMCIVLTAAASGVAQTLPSGIINSPPMLIGDSESIGSHTTLNVADGGSIGDKFQAGSESTLRTGPDANVVVNINGGTVGERFLALDDSRIYISGGTVGPGFFASNPAEIVVSGGSIGDGFTVLGGSVRIISGGQVGDGAYISNGSPLKISGGSVGNDFTTDIVAMVDMSGGTIGNDFRPGPGSTITISGGAIGDGFHAPPEGAVIISGGTFGDAFTAADTTIDIIGKEFFLDGAKLDLKPGVPKKIPDRNVPLTGRLVDGTQFDFDLFATARPGEDFFPDFTTLRLTLIPEPSTMVLLGLLVTCGLVARR